MARRLSDLWLELDLPSQAWCGRLQTASQQAHVLGLLLELSPVRGDGAEDLNKVVKAIADLHPPLTRLFCFPRPSYATTAVLTPAYPHSAGGGQDLRASGGGSRANFAEFNRATLPLDPLDVAGYHITTQVHAFDWRTLVESLEALQPTRLPSPGQAEHACSARVQSCRG